MRVLEMMEGARNVARVTAGIKPGEQVLIVTDTTKVAVAEALAIAAKECGAEVSIAVMTLRPKMDREPPRPIAAAMKSADVVMTPTTASMYHTVARIEACKAGARVVAMTGANEQTMMGEAIKVDFVKNKETVDKIAEAFTAAKTVRFQAPGGTDITASLEGRVANAESAVCHKSGECMGVPSVEANISPIEGTANGVVVCDASISEFGVIKEPIRMEVKNGKIVKVTGGAQARDLEKLLADTKDPNMYNIAEVAVGLNPKGKITGIIIEDESVLGTGHIGIGDNTKLGGVTKATFHIDAVIWHPTITLDGTKVVVKDGVPQV
ncbi:MAG: aminopeptidase [Bacillota bacterium]